MKLRRGLFWTKDKIPGVDPADGDDLISGREAPAFAAAVSRGRRRLGARTVGEIAEDDAMRGAGVPIFDRRSGQSELGTYLTRGRGQ